jgi:integrase
VIEKPNAKANTGYRMRWRDPQSGKIRKITLDPERYPDDAARRAAAERKSLEIRTASLDKREGVISVSIADAVSRYLAINRKRLRGRTMADYERVAGVFQTWCDAQHVTFARELTPPMIEAFRNDRLTLLRVRSDPDALRAPGTVNVELAATHTMLKAWRRLGWTPSLDTDAIADGLRKEAVPREDVEFLKPAQCRQLLRRALAHDADTFIATRREHAGKADPGTTARYTPIAPFMAVLLLSGMRFGEGLGLRWSDVDFDVHTITLSAKSTKTKRSRRFDLELSPMLAHILKALSLADNVARLPARERAARRVFPELTRDVLEASRKRMAKKPHIHRNDLHGKLKAVLEGHVEPWSWQTLRRTAATALANMSSVGPWQESQLLGHGVAVAEARYSRLLKVSPNAKTIEAALTVTPELVLISKAIHSRAVRVR